MGGMPVRALRMTLLAVVAIAALIAVMAPVPLGIGALAALPLGLRSGLQTLERLGIRGEVRGQRNQRNALPGGPLDVAQIAALVGAAEGNRNAVSTSASG